MDTREALQTMVEFLKPRVSAAVRVSGLEDERPVPLVLLEDWDLVDHKYHNTEYAGQADDPDDGVEKLWYMHYYTLRLDFLVRDDGDVEAHDSLDELRDALFEIQHDPLSFHPHVNDAKVRGAGGISHQFLESKETELGQSFQLHAYHQSTNSGFDTLETITNDIITQ